MRRTGKKWPDAIRERAIALLREGLDIQTISQRIGVPYQTIKTWRLLSIGPISTVSRHSRDVIEEARRRYLAGESRREIEAALGVPKSTLERWLVDLPAQHAPRRTYSPSDVRYVVSRVIEGGEEVGEVARDLHLPRTTVLHWVARAREAAERVTLESTATPDARRARYAIENPARALALSGAWR